MLIFCFALVSGGARDCHQLYVAGQRASGVYTIQPDGSEPFPVFCDMTSGGSCAHHLPEKPVKRQHFNHPNVFPLVAEGGWTVIQKRHDGSQNFNQPWESYKRGFGSLSGEESPQN